MNITQSLKNELSRYRGQTVFFEPLHGNNGDKLIEMGSLELLRQCEVNLVKKPQQAQLIVVNGGAGMTDIWVHGFQTLQAHNCNFPKTPLIICPSSFWFTKTDFPALFNNRVAPALIYAREAYSLDILKNLVFPGQVQLALDHDTAFHLEGAAHIQNLRTRLAQKHILIVERDDPECVTKPYPTERLIAFPEVTQSVTLPGWKNCIPKVVKRPIYRHVITPLKRLTLAQHLGERDLNSSFTQSCLQRVWQDYPDLEKLPVFSADISDPSLCSFAKFSQLIAEAAVVVTTRLHVAILAAMLDKPTYIKSGPYHKIQGIFDYSLADRDNMWFI
jgi:exopolysaccharide biosynthesis predicted pyruvyltransferase EpsI